MTVYSATTYSCRGRDTERMGRYLERISRPASLKEIAAHLRRSVRYAHSLALECDRLSVQPTRSGRMVWARMVCIRPNDCGRPHPQPYCLCVACHKAKGGD